MDRYLNVTEARRQLLDLVERLRGSDRVVITKRGRPRAVLVDSERYALLEDVAWLLQDPGRRAALHRAWDELQQGTLIRGDARGKPSVSTLRHLGERRGRRRRGNG
jgi:prevent-host-death family protein